MTRIIRRPGRADAEIDPELAAAWAALKQGGLLDGATLLDLAPNPDPATEPVQEAS